MSLSQALATAISGLRANQAGLSLVAANVANADTPGYVRKTVNQVAIAGNGTGIGVQVSRDQARARSIRAAAIAGRRIPARPMPTRARRCISSCRTSTASPAPATRSIRSTTISPRRCRRCRPARTIPPRAVAVLSSAQLLTQQLNQMSDQHPGPAQRCRARHLRRGDQGERGDAARSPQLNQQIAACRPNDSATADADGSARQLYRSAVAVDGHQRRHRPTTIRSPSSPIRACSSSAPGLAS